ncbi:MAG: hypothetical protein R3D86_05475 [Emcibacteraceae bacterium]
MMEPTEITITIDTECSIAGAFADPGKNKPIAEEAILCEIAGKEHGVGFLLETFERYGLKASFFVECAHYFYFGDNPMKNVIRRIIQAGQDTQLHIHPCWLNFIKDRNIGTFPINDSCQGREYDELKKIFELCIDVFTKWTGKKPDALRTGSLVADLNIYKVMKDLNIPLSSNIALGVNMPDEKELQLFGGRHLINGVMELPVFSYQDANFLGKKNIKSLQITSCSWPEMKYLLKKARKEAIKNIVILTHPFEFIKRTDARFSKMTRNRVNQVRLEKLCRFIAEHDQDFVSADFGSNAASWLEKGPVDQNLMEIPSYYMIGRKLHNKLNDTLWSY